MPSSDVPDISLGLSGDPLIIAINDRLRRLSGDVSGIDPGAADLNMQNHRVIAVGDAVQSQDALNLRTADKRYAAAGSVQGVQGPEGPPGPAGLSAAGSSASSDGWLVVSIVSNTATLNLATARAFKLTLNQATRVVIQITGSLPAGSRLTLNVFQDATGYRPTPDFVTSGLFGQDVSKNMDSSARSIAGDPNSYGVYGMQLHDDSKWHLQFFSTGQLY